MSRPDRKTGQVCREVLRTLTETLGGSGDPRLSSLTVLAVEPAPDASRLMVLVALPGRRHTTADADDYDPAAVTRRLGELRGMFRAEIASALQRKRTPELVFYVSVPPSHAGLNSE